MDPFIGDVRAVAFNFAPTGWALCNGQLLPISQNTALFSILGTTYGGDGKSTFGLPNLQGLVALGAGQGPGLSPRALGETGGSVNVTLLPTEIPAHTHTVNAATAPGTLGDPSGALLAEGRIGRAPVTGFASANPLPATTQLAPTAVGIAGGGQPHNNMPPYLTLNYIIALTGVYPPRS